MKTYISFIVYRLIAIHLPITYNIGGRFSKFFREKVAKGFIRYGGANLTIEKGAKFGRRLSIGDNSGIGINAVLDGEINIGENVMMGPDVIIYTQNHSFTRTDIPMNKQGFSNEKKVIIEDDVWIGARAIILPGVTIGKGCVIGAGSIVTKNMPSYSIIGGNPAKVLKVRNNYEY